MKKIICALAVSAIALAGCGDQAGNGGGPGAARSQIRVVGSSTVYPFTTAVAERFGQSNASFSAPIVESTGTGAGMELFCAGIGTQYPDIENASRRMKTSEFEECQRNGVTNVVEIPIGIDGLALIQAKNSPQEYQLTVADVYEALAADPYGQPNTAKTWQDVNPELPAVAIKVYGPPPTSGTRDSFAELILEKGCDSNPEMKALKESDSDKHKLVCTKIREDGAYIEAGENDNLLMQKVAASPGAVGVLGYSFYEENTDLVQAIPLEGVAPNPETISNLEYPGARQMFIYVKGDHVAAIPGLKEFLAEYARAWVDGGYLSERDLIPSRDDIQAQAVAAVTNLTPMTGAELN